jgi:hypothetical protein
MITYTAQSKAQADAVLETIASLTRTGHDDDITVNPPSFPESHELDGRVYVTGYKSAALDRCAIVHADGQVEWIR